VDKLQENEPRKPTPVITPFPTLKNNTISKGRKLNNRPDFPAAPLLIQRKLTLGNQDDAVEKEADLMAVQATQMTETEIRRKSISPVTSHARSASDNEVIGVPGIVHEVLRSPGQPLDTATQAYMESRFGYDFCNVRIHADTKAAESARMLEARAYTAGNNVVFGDSLYRSGEKSGLSLLAHELTHVVQQSKQTGTDSGKLSHRIQGSFFGDLWEGIKSVGRAIGSAVSSAVEWIGERFRDLGQWVVNLFRDLPARLLRLGEAILDGLRGVVTFIPEAISALASGGISGFASWLWEKVKAGGFWVLSQAGIPRF
jgi:hypothetical protein